VEVDQLPGFYPHPIQIHWISIFWGDLKSLVFPSPVNDV
jgi:hypothetical protein